MERRNIFRKIRSILFSATNREFLIFLFFLALSGTFWLLMTLNETYEKEFKIPIRIVGMPTNVVLTSEEYDTIRATVKDKGIVLITYFRYVFGDEIDRWVRDANGEGDPVGLLVARTKNFYNRKIVQVSSPTNCTSTTTTAARSACRSGGADESFLRTSITCRA